MRRAAEVNLVLGIWLVLAPFALAYSAALHHAALMNSIAVGLVLIVCWFWALTAPVGHGARFSLQFACGVWLMLAPFALHTRALPHVLANNAIVGGLALIASLVEIWTTTHPPQGAV